MLGSLWGAIRPYSGTLGPDDFDGWITEQGQDFVCLENGFDALCIKAIPGPRGERGKDGRDGRDGVDGMDGKPGRTAMATMDAMESAMVETVLC